MKKIILSIMLLASSSVVASGMNEQMAFDYELNKYSLTLTPAERWTMKSVIAFMDSNKAAIEANCGIELKTFETAGSNFMEIQNEAIKRVAHDANYENAANNIPVNYEKIEFESQASFASLISCSKKLYNEKK